MLLVILISKVNIIAKNTFSLFISGVICGLLQFITIAYIARILAPDNFGKINFALAIITYFTLLTNIGLPLLGTREIAKNQNHLRSIIKKILSLRLLLSCIGFLIILALSFIFAESADIRYLLIIYGVGVIPSSLFADWIFQGIQKMEYIAVGNLISTTFYTILILIFIKDQNQILLIPVFQVMSTILAVAILFLILYNKIIRPLDREQSEYPVSMKELIVITLPIGVSLIATQIFYNIDTIMLGIIKSTEEVGYYSAAYKIIMVFIIFIGYFHNSIFPIIANFSKSSNDALKRLLSLSQKFMVILAVPLLVGGIILANRIIKLIYGNNYLESVIPFQILLFAVFIIFINTNYSRTLLASGYERLYLLGTVVPALINIFLNIMIIPYYGMVGAAVVTVISEFVGFLIMYRGFLTITTIPFWELFFKPFCSVVIMGLALYAMIYLANPNLFILIFSGAAVYFIFLRFIGGLNEDDIGIIKRVFTQ